MPMIINLKPTFPPYLVSYPTNLISLVIKGACEEYNDFMSLIYIDIRLAENGIEKIVATQIIQSVVNLKSIFNLFIILSNRPATKTKKNTYRR